MKKTFMGSFICPNGIIGGKICIEDRSITYKTNKLTVDKQYKKIVLPLNGICELSWKWIVFPIATMRMWNGKRYKFIIFNKVRFKKWFSKVNK